MSSDPIEFNSVEYISTREAAKLTEYTSDYVGQLARAKKIRSEVRGHTRFVAKEDILAYSKGAPTLKVSSGGTRRTTPAAVSFQGSAQPAAPTAARAKDIETRYLADSGPVLPPLEKRTRGFEFQQRAGVSRVPATRKSLVPQLLTAGALALALIVTLVARESNTADTDLANSEQKTFSASTILSGTALGPIFDRLSDTQPGTFTPIGQSIAVIVHPPLALLFFDVMSDGFRRAVSSAEYGLHTLIDAIREFLAPSDAIYFVYDKGDTTTATGTQPFSLVVTGSERVIERIIVQASGTGAGSVLDFITRGELEEILIELNEEIDIAKRSPSNRSSGGGGSVTLNDSTIPDDITVSNYLLLAGGTLTGVLDSTFSGTSTFTGGFATDVLDVVSTTATSTFANGIQLAAGCFRLSDGTCAGAGGGASTYLALTDTQSSFTANRIIHTNSSGNALSDTAGFVFNG